MANIKTLILLSLPMHLLFAVHVTSTPSPPPSTKTSKKNTLPILASIAATSFLLLSITLFLIFRCLKHRSSSSKRNNNTTNPPQTPNNTYRHFSIAQIRTATNNFDHSLIIGNGGFGNVYKGHLDTCHHRSPVAIKRLKQDSDQGASEFQTEITMLSQLRHPHLVPLIGHCNDGDEMILVYEFMARGTLRDHLYNCDSQHYHPPVVALPWIRRLEICLAAARGLEFLHGGVNNRPVVIHRDVKSTNILLDENWVAKVSDFGLSKVNGRNESHVTTDVKGSLGYLDPEYYMSLWLSQKSDVYSFGVVMLEVLCGRAPIKRGVEKGEECLVAWVKKCWREGVVHGTVDGAVRGTIRPKCLNKFVQVAMSCLHEQGKQRPLMRDVVKGLECALRLQQQQGGGGGAQVVVREKETKIISVVSEDMDSGGSSKASTTTCSEEEQALVLFSQFGNSTPR